MVLIDVSMPEMDGFELAEMIRQHPRYEKTAIIFVSAVHLTDLDRLKGYESGAVDYVSVPVVPQLLRAKVRIFAELYRKTLESERLNRELEAPGRRADGGAGDLDARGRWSSPTSCARPTGARTSSWRCWPTSSATRWRRSGTRSSIMRFKELPDPELAWCRDVIERQTNQLTRLVDDLLDVSRITLGKIQLRARAGRRWARSSPGRVEMSRPIIDARRPPARRDPARDHRSGVHGDLARLTQVVANLLNNAAKYQDEGGRIELAVAQNGPEAMIAVRDQGIGLAAGDAAPGCSSSSPRESAPPTARRADSASGSRW